MANQAETELTRVNRFAVEPKKQQSTAKREVLTAEQDWIAFYIKNDAKTLSSFLTDDFLYISPLGEVLDRITYLQKLTRRRVQTESIKLHDVSVRIYEHTAIVTATWEVKETYKGSSDQGLNRTMRVWLRQPDRWRVAAFQVTSLPP